MLRQHIEELINNKPHESECIDHIENCELILNPAMYSSPDVGLEVACFIHKEVIKELKKQFKETNECTSYAFAFSDVAKSFHNKLLKTLDTIKEDASDVDSQLN